MKVGIAVFSYNRSSHLKQVLDALKENEGVDKLYLFQDGLKCEKHRVEWEKTRTVIEELSWCQKDVRCSKENKGCAASITDGIIAVLEENDAVIILEDDCVPAPAFISFTKQCLAKYENDKQVYSVGGWSWPMETEEKEENIYFCGRTSSWGWATWKDRWALYQRDYDVIKRLKNTKDGSMRLAAWGLDLENMLVAELKNQIDAWDVFWSLTVIENHGYNVVPYYNLIHNIGIDGSGLHCGDQLPWKERKLYEEKHYAVNFPEKVSFRNDVVERFADIYGSYAVLGQTYDENKESVIVYGLGAFYRKNEKILLEQYNIAGYADSMQKGYYIGKKILSPQELTDCDCTKIVIMIKNKGICANVAEKLVGYGIPADKICFGIDCISVSV